MMVELDYLFWTPRVDTWLLGARKGLTLKRYTWFKSSSRHCLALLIVVIHRLRLRWLGVVFIVVSLANHALPCAFFNLASNFALDILHSGNVMLVIERLGRSTRC